jgi:Family of unknown function (DUF6516)
MTCRAAYDNLCHMQHARRILHRKRHYDDGTISELTLWQVPNPVRGSTHAFKYSLFYGRAGVRLVGYDNEPGKGDHRHYEGIEEPYRFTTPEQLIRDFLADVRRVRRQR